MESYVAQSFDNKLGIYNREKCVDVLIFFCASSTFLSCGSGSSFVKVLLIVELLQGKINCCRDTDTIFFQKV